MPSVENPKGLTFADFIASAESSEAKAAHCRKLAEGKLTDEINEWLLEQAAKHEADAEHFRSLARAMGDTDPAAPESL